MWVVGIAIILASVAGTGDAWTDREEYVESLSLAILGDPPSNGDSDITTVVVTYEEAECLAAAVVDSIGVDALNLAGVTAEELAEGDGLEALGIDLEPDRARQMATRVEECDFGEKLSDLVVAELESLLPVAEPTTESMSCFSTYIDENFADVLVAAVVDGSLFSEGAGFQAGQDLASSAFDACPEFAAMVIAEGMNRAGLETDDDFEACLASRVEASAPGFGAEMQAAVEDPEAASQLMLKIVSPCVHLINAHRLRS